MFTSVIVCGLALAPLVGPQGPVVDRPAVDAANFAQIVGHVMPAPDELVWRAIPWRPSLRQGVVDGLAERKPVVLWAMNGHPLGTT